MAAVCDVFDGSGQLFLSLADCTTVQVGAITATSYSLGLPTTGSNSSYYIDFACPAGTAPWAYAMGANNVFAVVEVGRINGSAARVTFNLGGPNPFPAGGRLVLRYGWGRA